MRRHRNMAQMKEQSKSPEKELNKMEISNLSDAEFKILFIRMLKELSEDLNSIKKIQSETNNTLFEIKNSRMDEAKNQINNMEHKEAKNNHTQQQKQKESKKKKNEDDINSFWDNFKRSNIHLLGVPEGE